MEKDRTLEWEIKVYDENGKEVDYEDLSQEEIDCLLESIGSWAEDEFRNTI